MKITSQVIMQTHSAQQIVSHSNRNLIEKKKIQEALHNIMNTVLILLEENSTTSICKMTVDPCF